MKKFILLILVIIFALGSFGCTRVREDEKIIMLASFESDNEIMSSNYKNYFGKVSQNSNSDYISHGNSSVKCEIYGDPTYSNVFYHTPIIPPYMSIFTNSKYLNKNDFSDVTAFSLDIFNAGKDTEMTLLINGRSVNNADTVYNLGNRKLFAGKNELRFEFDRDMYARGYSIDKVKSFDLVFEHRQNESEDPYVIYIDNFFAVKANNYTKTVKQRENYEIFSYDSLEDVYSCYNGSDHDFRNHLKYSLNLNPKYISTGKGSLKISRPKSSDMFLDWFLYTSWYGMNLDSTALGGFDFSDYEINKLSLNFDVKTNIDSDKLFFMMTDLSGNIFTQSIEFNNQDFTTYSINLSELNGVGYNKIDLFKLNKIMFSFEEYFTGETREVYIDNFVLEEITDEKV